MGPARAVCVGSDPRICQAVDAALSALSGVAVGHCPELPADTGGAALVVVDRAAREAAGAALLTAGAPVVVVGDDLDDDALVALMTNAPVSHLVGDLADRDLDVTCAKLVSGDLFGLEKYLSPGAPAGHNVTERMIQTDAERRAAVAEVVAWAERVGARTPILHRLACVVDELLMNALHDAPRVAKAPPTSSYALLRWASDDAAIAISVTDAFGALRQRDLISHVQRAREERGKPVLGEHGAGLGLYLVLANVAGLVVNLEPRRRTEVVCLFDLAPRDARRAVDHVRSLHVFGAP